MAYTLGQRSMKRLRGAQPALRRVVQYAIMVTSVDFTVLEVVRSTERQRKLFATRATRTMNSRHLTGHAVDLGAYVDRTIRWDWPLYFDIAEAMKRASEAEDVELVWGGAWDQVLTGNDLTPIEMNRQYILSNNSFPDGPHFELSWRKYPKK